MPENCVADLIIRKVKEDRSAVEAVVSIHLATFQGFFLTFMGRGFLRKMYLSYTQHTESDLYIAVENGTAIGFLACSKDMSGLYKFMLKKHLIGFAWYSAGALLRKPKVFLKLIRAFLKPGEARREERYIELSSIGVYPAAKGRGVGSKLLETLKNAVDFSEFAYIALETDAINNEIANQFYAKNGFSCVRTFTTQEGRKMHEYRYRKDISKN